MSDLTQCQTHASHTHTHTHTVQRCRTGDAVITVGGELKAKWCIHAVGPDYRMCGQGISGKESLEDGDRAVHNAYTSSMALGKAKAGLDLAPIRLSVRPPVRLGGMPAGRCVRGCWCVTRGTLCRISQFPRHRCHHVVEAAERLDGPSDASPGETLSLQEQPHR